MSTSSNLHRGGVKSVSDDLERDEDGGWGWRSGWDREGSCKEMFHKCDHMQKPLGLKSSWAGSVNLTWI